METSPYDTKGFTRRDAFAATEAVISSWADVQPVEHARNNFQTRWRMWSLDNLLVSEAITSPMKFDRNAKRFSSLGNKFLLLEMFHAGSSAGVAGDMVFENAPGRICLIDMSRGFCSVSGAFSTRDLLISHDAIGYDLSIHPAVSSMAVNTPSGRILAQIIATLPERIGRLSRHEEAEFSREIAQVVRSLLLTPDAPEPVEVRRARRVAIENYIETRLDDPSLSIAQLCAVFGQSRATIYRHFGGANGVFSHIRSRRLNAAHLDLLSTPHSRGFVRRISEKYGFYDPSHFNRLFKARFCKTPGELSGRARRDPWVPVTPVTLLKEWQNGLCR